MLRCHRQIVLLAASLLALFLSCLTTTASSAASSGFLPNLNGQLDQLKKYNDKSESVLHGVPATHVHFNKRYNLLHEHDYATLFVGLASFRDIECMPTVRDLYKRALNPRRVVLGIIEQNEHGDPTCIPDEFFNCRSGDFCPIDNIRRRRVAARHGKGPTYGRYVSMLSYRGESYYMMMDSHNEVVRDWDRRSIVQLHRTRSTRPVLSHYPNGWDKNGQTYESQGNMMVMCKGIFVGQGYVRNGAQWMPRHPEPRLQPYTAAGYLMGDGLMVHEVPFDPYLDFIFDGEELLYTARLWSRGWDAHTPGDNIVFHDYNRHKAPRYWGTQAKLGGAANLAMKDTTERAQLILKVLKKDPSGEYVPMIDPSKYDASSRVIRKLDVYGLGSVRSLEDLYKMGDVEMKQRKAGDSYCQYLNAQDRKFSQAPVR